MKAPARWFFSFILVFQLSCSRTTNVEDRVAQTTNLEQQLELQTKVEPANEAVENLPRKAQPGDWFADVTASSGVTFTHRNGRAAGRYLTIESNGGGVALIDFDLDDFSDLFFTGGGTISADEPVEIKGLPCGLFRNEGEFRFSDVSAPASVDAQIGYSQGCAVTDYDVDGFPDLLVCCYGVCRLFGNQGDGTFQLVDEQKLPTEGWGTAAAFGDQNQDGFPDMMLARYTDWSLEKNVICYDLHGKQDLCGPSAYGGITCQFFRNLGDGSFVDKSEQVGIKDGVHGLGVIVSDLNDDGHLDFYVSSDAMPNHLYMGGPEFFEEKGLIAGVASGEWGQPEAGMGLDVGDYNGDGLADIFVTNFENEDNSLYRNLGGGQWIHNSVSTGISSISRRRVGFGVCMQDFNGDGWLDLFILNGNAIYTTGETPYRQPAQLLHNQGGVRFEEISDVAGPYFAENHSGRGCAAGDLDNDGALDLVTVLMNEPIRILKNRNQPENFVHLKLIATRGERDATGAKIEFDSASHTLVRWITKGTSFFSQNDSRILIPVQPDIGEVEIRVQWPGRGREVFRKLRTVQTHQLIEGQGDVLP